MKQYEFEVFQQTSDYAELRFTGDTGAVSTRGLSRADIDQLVDLVDRVYDQGSVAPQVFGSAQLRGLGEKLFGFLDGDERWLTDALTDPRGATLRISAEERLRHLPWELAAREGAHLTISSERALLPVRAIGRHAATAAAPKNRPLRVLFMATSPEGVKPVLDYEEEEAGILKATAATGTELVVEESGSLEGLEFTARAYGEGYFDVLHLSGHATVRDGQPTFLVENELGAPALATAGQIAEAMSGQWPRLVFVSGCLTGAAPSQGLLPSMSESLVQAGAPAVLGWALPVGDVTASEFAAHLYKALAAGRRLDQSVVAARRALYQGQRRHWHLLRMYADKSPLTPMVTPYNTPRRGRIQLHHAATRFLDPQTRLSRVASREEFVGRRRVIQRCLRTLMQPSGAPGSAEALVLHGMGGLGKSTLASRLLERTPTHQRVVWFGRVDLIRFRDLTSMITFESMEQYEEATKALANDEIDLGVRLRYLLSGPLANIPCVFVFDDFEHNLEERDGGHVLSPEVAAILPALLRAIREANSPSRVIITSRYRFPTPAGASVKFESLETLTDVDQTKKVARLSNLRPVSNTPPDIRERAIAAASGNPRLLDWLDKIVADDDLDVDALIAAIENEVERFRENILAKELVGSQSADLQKMLARLDVVNLPIPRATVDALHDHPDAAQHLDRAVQLGLVEEGTDPGTGEPQYFVSNVLRPILRPLITDDEYAEACAAAARSLHKIWCAEPDTDTPEQP